MTTETYADAFCRRISDENVPMPQWFQRALDEINLLAGQVKRSGSVIVILESEVAEGNKVRAKAIGELQEVRDELRKTTLCRDYSVSEERRLKAELEQVREQGKADHARAEHLESLFAFLCSECLDLRCQSAAMADTGDYDIWWEVIEHHMDEPRERRIGSGPSPIEALQSAMRSCRVCGCTDLDCSGCIERTGEPCHWVETDLCSACAGPKSEAARP